MALYDDASFIFLASASAGQERKDASKVYNVKPAPIASSTNAQDLSTFTITNVSNAANSISVSGGVATFAGDGSEFTYLDKASVFEANKKYKVVATVEILSGTQAGQGVKFQDGDTDEKIGVATVSGKYAFYFTSASSGAFSRLRIARKNSESETDAADAPFEFKVSDVSVSEVDVLPADFDISRDANLIATRVGPTGLIERGRENLILQSNGFDTTWTSTDVSESIGQTGYDGSTNAWLVTKTASTNSALRQNFTSFSGVTTFSVHAKAGTLNGINIQARSSGTTHSAQFDLSNGTLGSDANEIDSNISFVGNGWYRCSVTFNASSVNQVRIFVCTDGSTVGADVGTILIQDSQLEAGLVATDVITTTFAAATAGIKEDEPRFDYPLAGGAPSLLLEPERRNIQPISENFSAYGTDDASVTANADISPEGVKNAAKLVEDSGNSTHKMHPPNGDSFTSGTTYSISVFAKAAGRTQFKLQAGTTDTAPYNAVFNLTGESSPTTPTNNDEGTASMEYYGNDWYRCKIEGFEADATATTKTNFFLQSSGNASYDGDGTSGILFYGLQLEEGPYASSYIPTHGAAATRTGEGEAVDTFKAQLPTALNGASAYTLFMDLTVTDLEEETDFRDVVVFKDSSSASTKYAFKLETFTDSGTSSLRGFVYKTADPNAVVSIAHDTIAIGSRCKLAVVVNSASGIKAFYNGSSTPVINYAEVTTYESVDSIQGAEHTIPGTRSRTRLHAIHGYPSALSDAQCISLTTL